MAQRVNIVLVDDIDGGDADETVSFALDGVSYDIDLSTKNAGKLRDALAPYVAAGRRSGGRRSGRRSSGARSGGSGASAAEIRKWARGNGYDVPERGRIPNEVRAAYDAAH